MLDDTLILTSHPQSIQDLEAFLNPIRDKYKLSDTIYPRILISLTEAVNNAIHHGNRCDLKKCVHVVQIYKEKKSITFRVSDEGPGFDPNLIPDPTASCNCDKEGGRGVFLMKNLADEICYLDNGRTVEIIFNLPDACV